MSPSRIYTPLKRPILDLIYSVKSVIHHLIILIKSTHTLPLHLRHCISIHTQTYKRSYNSNSPFLHLWLLIICEIAMYALSFTQHLSIMPLQILTQAPLFSHFPSKTLNKCTSFPKNHRNAYMA